MSGKRWGVDMIFFLKIDIKVFCNLVVSIFCTSHSKGMSKVFKIESLQYLCIISKQKEGMKLIICIQTNIKLSYTLIPLILVDMDRLAQITQSKFAKSSQYLKKELRDEVDFLCSWTSQLSISWYCHFWWMWPDMSKVLKTTSMQRQM